MLKFEVRCAWCGKDFERDVRRINEAQKNNWRHFCSLQCLRLARQKGKYLTCNNPSCNKQFYRRLADINKTTRSFCSHNCSAITHNLEKGLKNAKKCQLSVCKNISSPGHKFCSLTCFFTWCKTHRRKYKRISTNLRYMPNNKIPKKVYINRVIQTIRQFVQQHGRIPLKRELNVLYRPARLAFGTWNNAIKAAGFKPNQLKFTHRYIANDKHICDSLAEKIIDDWLFSRKIKHQINDFYPENKKFTVDFKIGDYWIEFFGLSGQLKTYDELKLQKIELAKKHKLKLIKIYPHDLFPKNQLAKRLSFLLH